MKLLSPLSYFFAAASFFVHISNAQAQCSTVNLSQSFSQYRSFPANNTVCRFGGVRYATANTDRTGILSCLSASVPITTANESSFRTLLATVTDGSPISQGQIFLITNSVRYAFISYRDNNVGALPTTLGYFSKNELLTYVNSGYSLPPVGQHGIHGQSTARTNFSPAGFYGSYTENITMSIDLSSWLFSVSGYDQAGIAPEFVIYRTTGSSNSFAPFEVCENAAALPYTDFIFKYGLTYLSSPTNLRYRAY
jgi:hypothetical protein